MPGVTGSKRAKSLEDFWKVPEVISASECALSTGSRLLNICISWPAHAYNADDWAKSVQEIVTELENASPWYSLSFRANGGFEELTSHQTIRVGNSVGSVECCHRQLALTAGQLADPNGQRQLNHTVLAIVRNATVL